MEENYLTITSNGTVSLKSILRAIIEKKLEMNQIHNKGGIPKNRFLYNLMMRKNYFKTIFNFFIRGFLRKKIKLHLDKKNLTSIILDLNDKLRYKSIFKDDIIELEKLLNIKLNHWKL